MRKLKVFNFITLNGYFEGPKKGEMNWHRHGEEENKFAVEMLKSKSIFIKGRLKKLEN